MKKLEDEREEELARLQENLRSRDNQIRVLEKNIEERFGEIALVSQMLLDAKGKQEEEREKLRSARERIDHLSQRNEQLKQVGIKRIMARSYRKYRTYLAKLFERS
ncbi:hypothetical protein D3C72_575280 [compost metagenome]